LAENTEEALKSLLFDGNIRLINDKVANFEANGTFPNFFITDPADEILIYEAQI
jgi:hypothetical protein